MCVALLFIAEGPVGWRLVLARTSPGGSGGWWVCYTANGAVWTSVVGGGIAGPRNMCFMTKILGQKS